MTRPVQGGGRKKSLDGFSIEIRIEIHRRKEKLNSTQCKCLRKNMEFTLKLSRVVSRQGEKGNTRNKWAIRVLTSKRRIFLVFTEISVWIMNRTTEWGRLGGGLSLITANANVVDVTRAPSTARPSSLAVFFLFLAWCGSINHFSFFSPLLRTFSVLFWRSIAVEQFLVHSCIQFFSALYVDWTSSYLSRGELFTAVARLVIFYYFMNILCVAVSELELSRLELLLSHWESIRHLQRVWEVRLCMICCDESMMMSNDECNRKLCGSETKSPMTHWKKESGQNLR